MIDLSVFFKDLWEEFVCYMMIFDGILELGKLNDSSSLIVNNMEKYDVWCDDVEGICISDGQLVLFYLLEVEMLDNLFLM